MNTRLTEPTIHSIPIGPRSDDCEYSVSDSWYVTHTQHTCSSHSCPAYSVSVTYTPNPRIATLTNSPYLKEYQTCFEVEINTYYTFSTKVWFLLGPFAAVTPKHRGEIHLPLSIGSGYKVRGMTSILHPVSSKLSPPLTHSLHTYDIVWGAIFSEVLWCDTYLVG